jgi:hypothetical protein
MVVLGFVATCGAVASQAAAVTFESLTAGSAYGPPAHSPGDPIFVEDQIQATVEEYYYSSGTIAPWDDVLDIFAEGETPPYGFGDPPQFNSGNFMGSSNVAAGFDFTGLPYAVTYVSIEYVNAGGNENIGVNGQPVHYDLISTAPAAIAPGVTLSTSMNPNTSVWTMELTGAVTSVRIGGQEFALDNVYAIPEPTTAMMSLCVALLCCRRVRGS